MVSQNQKMLASAVFDSISEYQTDSAYGKAYQKGYLEGMLRLAEIYEIPFNAYSEQRLEDIRNAQ